MQLLKKRGLYETGKVVYIPVEDLSPNPAQPRKNFDADSLTELAASISRYGVLQPLNVRRRARGYELVSGERRLRAAKLAGLNEVPCIVLDVDLEESSILAMVENLQRNDLGWYEEAQGLNQLMRLFGLGQDEVARRVGKSQSAVANKLRILKLAPELIRTLLDHDLTERHARALLRLPEDQRPDALRFIVEHGLNVAGTDEYIERVLAGDIEPDYPEDRKVGRGRRRIYVRDIRLFLNTVDRSMRTLQSSGISAYCGRCETDTDIILTIKLPKE